MNLNCFRGYHYLDKLLMLIILAGCSNSTTTEPEAERVVLPTVTKPVVELSVGFVIVDGVFNSELVAPMDVLQHTIFHTDPGMRVFVVAPSNDIITTFEGLKIVPDYSFEDAPDIDVLVVPSAKHSMDTDLENSELISFVSERGRKAKYVMSLCDGAFVLAKAGLVDGYESTTFPWDIPKYRAMYPDLKVHENVSFVHDRKLITSAGGAKSYDPALYLVELLYGQKPVTGIAGGLVIDWDLRNIDHLIIKQ